MTVDGGVNETRAIPTASGGGIGRGVTPGPHGTPATSRARLWLIVALAVVTGALVGFGAMYFVGGGTVIFGR